MHRLHLAHGRRHGEAGFTMVMLVVILAVMAIMMTVAVQTVTTQMKREREAELIFRGNQYVEAIRLYKAKFGRLPNSLKEIWEAKPRVIRQKWVDPMTGSANWAPIFLGSPGHAVGGRGRQLGGGQGSLPTPTPTPPPGDEGGGGGLFGKPAQSTGPIVGVHSISTEHSLKVYEGHTQYDQWDFVIPEVKPGASPAAVPRTDSGSPFLPPGVSLTPRPTPPGGGGNGPPGRWTPRPRGTPRR